MGQCLWCCHHDTSHCERSPGSSDECRPAPGRHHQRHCEACLKDWVHDCGNVQTMSARIANETRGMSTRLRVTADDNVRDRPTDVTHGA